MLSDPPLLVVNRHFERPSSDLLAAFEGASTGFVVDAMGGRGALHYLIRPLATSSAPLVGVALTCHAGPADNLAVFGAFNIATPGDIVMVATDSFTGTAVVGDHMAGMAKNCGVIGIVTDGLARDVAGIREVGLPVYCAGLSANTSVRSGPGTVGLPVEIGGAHVESGDIVVADEDGVVVVPRRMAEDVARALPQIREAEAELGAEIKAGLKLPSFVAALMGSGKIQEV